MEKVTTKNRVEKIHLPLPACRMPVSLLYSRTIRFSFLHCTYCPLIRYGLCRNWKILTVVRITYFLETPVYIKKRKADITPPFPAMYTCSFRSIPSYSISISQFTYNNILYSRAIRFSILHCTYCPLMQWAVQELKNLNGRSYTYNKSTTFG